MVLRVFILRIHLSLSKVVGVLSRAGKNNKGKNNDNKSDNSDNNNDNNTEGDNNNYCMKKNPTMIPMVIQTLTATSVAILCKYMKHYN